MPIENFCNLGGHPTPNRGYWLGTQDRPRGGGWVAAGVPARCVGVQASAWAFWRRLDILSDQGDNDTLIAVNMANLHTINFLLV
jgi:hypothetical protein